MKLRIPCVLTEIKLRVQQKLYVKKTFYGHFQCKFSPQACMYHNVSSFISHMAHRNSNQQLLCIRDYREKVPESVTMSKPTLILLSTFNYMICFEILWI